MTYELVVIAIAFCTIGYWLGWYKALSEQPYKQLGKRIREGIEKCGQVNVHVCVQEGEWDDGEDDSPTTDDLPEDSNELDPSPSPGNRWRDN